uniref:Transposase, MuDR, MULE transposase domain protein n=1 Tax=Tanacetum cinerariifolium TaxID=118510 RepID=A0A6L2K522_TANCI|nr:transposase, MuDR, MULE transposase domain protein [Tanacetum cinerariifolium]
MHHRNATTKLLDRLLEPKFKDNTRIYKGNDIQQDIYTDKNIDISYKQAWRAKNVALKYISGCPVASFAQLPYYCHNLESTNGGTVTHIEIVDEDRFKMVFFAFGVVIRSFKYHMRLLIIINATHLKGRYEGKNLLAVGMDGNNQIIPIATDVERWSRAYCPRDRYNYMTSNSAESINSLTRDVRKVPITNLIEWYRKLVQGWYCERREKYKDGPLDELSGWAKAKIRKRMQKSLNWVVVGITVGSVYEVDDRRRIQTMELCNGTYQELVYHVGEVSSWHIPNYLRVVKPPHMDKQPSGRPKSMKRIRSQGGEPVQSYVEGAGRVVTTDKGVGKPFHSQKKGHILEEAHSKQMTSYAINDVVFRCCQLG